MADVTSHPVSRTARRGQGLKTGKLSLSIRLPIPVLLYILALVIPASFNLGPLSLSLMRLLLLVTIVPVTLGLLTGRYGRVMASDFLFIAFILWSTVALGVNNPNRVVENVGSSAVEMLGGYVLARAYIRTPEAFAALCRLLVILVILMVPLAIYEAKTSHRLVISFIERLPFVYSYYIAPPEYRMGLSRVQLVFPHPILYGLFCSTVFSLAFVASRGLLGTMRRYVVSSLVAIATLLSLSSGALLPLFLQIGLIGWAFVFQKVAWRWYLLLALMVLAYIAIDIASNRTPIQVMMSYATFSPHNAWWRAAIFEFGMQNVWANPVFGIGLNNWARASWMHSDSVDNFWLVNAMRYGIPGFLLIAAGYLTAVVAVARNDLSGSPLVAQFRQAWMFVFLGLSFTLTTVHIWANVYSYVFFLLGAGAWMAFYKPEASATAVAREAPNPRGLARPLRRRGERAGAIAGDAVTGDSPSVNPDSGSMNGPEATTGPDGDRELRYSRFPQGNGSPTGSPRK